MPPAGTEPLSHKRDNTSQNPSPRRQPLAPPPLPEQQLLGNISKMVRNEVSPKARVMGPEERGDRAAKAENRMEGLEMNSWHGVCH